MFFFKTKINATKKIINKMIEEVDNNFEVLLNKNLQNIENIQNKKIDRASFFMRQPEKENEILENFHNEFLDTCEVFNLLIERLCFDNKKIEQIHVDFFNYLKIYKSALDKAKLGCSINLATKKVAKDEIIRRFNNLKNE